MGIHLTWARVCSCCKVPLEPYIQWSTYDEYAKIAAWRDLHPIDTDGNVLKLKQNGLKFYSLCVDCYTFRIAHKDKVSREITGRMCKPKRTAKTREDLDWWFYTFQKNFINLKSVGHKLDYFRTFNSDWL